jgi:hypothetical protein
MFTSLSNKLEREWDRRYRHVDSSAVMFFQNFRNAINTYVTIFYVAGDFPKDPRKFACGISPASNAKTVRKQPDGTVLVTDGPYTETKEHMGGFWILECADIDEALAWAKKGAIACDVAGEVRELLFYPDPKGATE